MAQEPNGLAPPLVAGWEVRLTSSWGRVGYVIEYTIETESISTMPSSYDVIVTYVNTDGKRVTETYPAGSGKTPTTITLEANTLQQPTVRFRSHSIGQIIVISTSQREVPEPLPPEISDPNLPGNNGFQDGISNPEI